jgi:hypothetical protein
MGDSTRDLMADAARRGAALDKRRQLMAGFERADSWATTDEDLRISLRSIRAAAGR